MTIFDVLTLLGGLCLFLFGMNIMGKALEACAGSRLSTLLSKLTSNKFAGFLTGLGITAVIQSSSATTVMVVGFVNSGLMTLKQSIGVIMGANVGTTVTAWILSLTGVEGAGIMQLLKPSSFTPVLALIGIGLYMFAKTAKKKDVGMVLLGFATLMYGMTIMSDAVSGLKDVPEFRNILLMFSNPILGVLAGVVLTAIIQSSSAAVGILQALSSTGQITFGSAIPIILGMGIGTCVTAMLSSIGANRDARRAATIHLLFNVIGTVVWLAAFYAVDAVVGFTFFGNTIDEFWIAVVNTVFKMLCTVLLMPMSGILEKLACIIIKDTPSGDKTIELDERLLATPAVALERCHAVTVTMGEVSIEAIKNAMSMLSNPFDNKMAQLVRSQEDDADHYEDTIGSYLVKLSGHALADTDSTEAAKLLRIIGDFERISDHAVNVLESVEEMKDKNIVFTQEAQSEIKVLTGAVSEVLDLAHRAFEEGDLEAATLVEPLEQVVDTLKEQLRARHILRLQKGDCTIEAGFVWSDLLTSLERVADHCSNIAGCVVETAHSALDLHEYIRGVKAGSTDFNERYSEFAKKYALIKE
ncbi:MAG: Na/Pi cotransporter family protein [Oscillospiraceae bacterium]|nr:Na/Pi cotransporter family protein [Oscillospiraceae bacterium]